MNDGIYSYTYGAPSCSCANRIEIVTDSSGVTTYEYDYKGRVKMTIYPDGTIVENIFDEIAKTKTIKLDGEILFVINLDGEGRASGNSAIVEQIGGANNIFAITRDNVGRIKEVLY
ncbi:MAG: RHS repeat domain-containing protein, partial [Sulfolobaceae archaeon]